MYIESKAEGLNGQARIGRVTFSKSRDELQSKYVLGLETWQSEEGAHAAFPANRLSRNASLAFSED